MAKRVVVTGMGVVSPIGSGKDVFWQEIKQGKNGIGPITHFDASESGASLAAQVNDFEPTEYMTKKAARRMDRFQQFAFAAAKLCMDDAQLDASNLSEEERERFGTIISSGVGGLQTMGAEEDNMRENGMRRVSPFMIPMMITNLASGLVAIEYGLKGMCTSPVTACATSASAVGDAYRMIKHGYLDRVLCGGAEATITPLGVSGFVNMKALSKSTDPNRASIPFDKERNGFVMGEGGAVLLLEEYEMAKKRGATIYAEVLGYGATCDAHHITAPDPEAVGAVRSMRDAMSESDIALSKLDYINAHGTSTPPNDKMETLAIKTLFGEQAEQIAVSSTKSMTGHMLGGAGAIESIVCICAIQDNFVPATINYEVLDEDCDLDYVPNVGREQKVDYALTNSFGFGGHNVSLLFGRCE